METISSKVITRVIPNVNFPVSESPDGIGYLSNKVQDSKMGVIVIQEWWGLNLQIKETTDKFAEQGFLALAPDLYRGEIAKDTEHAGHLLEGLNWSAAVKDIVGAVKFLKSKGCKKIGVVGFCMGGALVIASMTTGEIDAGACFYGVPDLSKQNFNLAKGRYIIAHFGKEDNLKGFSDPETAKKLEKVLKEAGVHIEMHFYDGVGHAFTNHERSDTYNPTMANLAFQRTFDFFKKHLSS
jgi:carboxymethylenebutenolidase